MSFRSDQKVIIDEIFSGELHKRTEIIKSLTKKVKTLESNQIECQAALQKTQLQLQEMAQKATHSSLLSEDLEVGFIL